MDETTRLDTAERQREREREREKERERRREREGERERERETLLELSTGIDCQSTELVHLWTAFICE